MPNTYAFHAASRDGRVNAGSLDAKSIDDARAMLAARGLFTLDIVEQSNRHTQRRQSSSTELALALRILADLLDSGLSVGRALVVFEDLAPTAWQRALPSMQESIRQGDGLADALSRAPIGVPPLIIGIVRAGEATGTLSPSVRRAADLTEAMAETESAVRSALVYPAIVAIAGLGAIAVLIAVVLPRFAVILADLGQELPLSTRVVLQVGNYAKASLLPVSAAALLASVAAKIAFDTSEGRRRRDRTLLAIPVVGRIRRGAAVARITQSLATMLETGVPMSNALTVAAQAGGDAELEHRMIAARSMIGSGEPLSNALAAAGAATPTVLRLIRAGEQSGRLSSMLQHASQLERRATERAVRSFVRLIEPTLLLTFAVIVGFVAAALLQAIYSVRPGAS